MELRTIAGTTLELKWAPDGVLSKALLEGKDVTIPFRYLREDTALVVLEPLGYRESFSQTERDLARHCENRLKNTGFWLLDARVVPEGVVITLTQDPPCTPHRRLNIKLLTNRTLQVIKVLGLFHAVFSDDLRTRLSLR